MAKTQAERDALRAAGSLSAMSGNLTPPSAEEEHGQDVYEKFVERVNEIQAWCPACGGSGMVMEYGPTDCPNLESHRMLAYLTEQFPANWIIQSAQQRVEQEWGDPRW